MVAIVGNQPDHSFSCATSAAARCSGPCPACLRGGSPSSAHAWTPSRPTSFAGKNQAGNGSANLSSCGDPSSCCGDPVATSNYPDASSASEIFPFAEFPALCLV